MKKKSILIYFLLSISIGFLLYNYLFSDVRYGMMGHHYGYYDDYSGGKYYLNALLMFVAYAVIFFGMITLLGKKTKQENNSLNILDHRLSKGEISIEEYQRIKKEIS